MKKALEVLVNSGYSQDIRMLPDDSPFLMACVVVVLLENAVGPVNHPYHLHRPYHQLQVAQSGLSFLDKHSAHLVTNENFQPLLISLDL